MRFFTRRFAAAACILFVLNSLVFGAVRLPRLISDGMVVQRDVPVRVWGWADAGEKVTVTFAGERGSAAADAEGRWEVTLEPMGAGGPFEIEVKGDNRIVIRDVLVGDVWVCSGQSNMELMMERVRDTYADVIAGCSNPRIRHYEVPDRYDFQMPREDLEGGKWEAANPESVLKFTAVGYFFARELYEKHGVPVGLINASLGGSPAQAWLSGEALGEFPSHIAVAKQYRNDAYVKSVIDRNNAISREWYGRLDRFDEGLAGGTKWFDPACDMSGWDSMDVPGYWAKGKLGALNGAVWFRRDFEVPAEMVDQQARLELGCIVDSDKVYVNGTLAGTTGYRYPPRRYDIEPGVLKEGRNTIVVRVISASGEGGFVEDKPYQLTAGGRTVDLSGAWKYRLGAVMEPLPGEVFVRWQPAGLYNGMIAPLTKMPIKGVTWYQGESNTANPAEYESLFGAVITDWRAKWGQGEFPFLYVQLANFMETKAEPTESSWALVRDAQRKALALKNTGMAVAIDLGEWNDIHPVNKRDVGRRLALAAERIAYGDSSVVYSGPIYRSMRIEGNKAVLSFGHVGRGLVCRGGELKSFAVAGADGRFVWAKAEIRGDEIVVWSDEIDTPAAVRYAWADNPEGANLYNKEGLPASPFRTSF